MDSLIIRLIEGGGYFGIAVLMALENIFPPIPSELIMGVGGISVSKGTMVFAPLLIAGTIGATLGNYVLFLAADRWGYERMRPFVDRYGRWLTMDWDEILRARRFLERHGQWVVFLMRFLPIFRTVISIPAGLAHMGHLRFVIFTAAGAAIWNTALILLGEWLGDSFSQAEVWIGHATLVVVVITVAWYVWRVVRWRPKA